MSKPKGIVFDQSWRRLTHIEPCSISDVDSFIKSHYLRKRPAITQLCMRLLFIGSPMGCIVYSSAPRESNVRYGGKVWELARLYLVDAMPTNSETWFIAKSVRHIRRHHRDVDVLVSYADPSVGHSGTIYRAAGWQQDGMTDDERKSPRVDLVDAQTGKKFGRWGNVPKGTVVLRVPRVSKPRFILRLK